MFLVGQYFTALLPEWSQFRKPLAFLVQKYTLGKSSEASEGYKVTSTHGSCFCGVPRRYADAHTLRLPIVIVPSLWPWWTPEVWPQCSRGSKAFSSVQSRPTLRPQGLQHTRLPCPSPTPGAYSNFCSLSWWCHPTISSSVIPFSSCLQSFPGSGSFPMSQLFASGDQSIGVSASVLLMNIQGCFPLGFGNLVWSPCSPRDSRESSHIPQFKSINSSALSFLYSPTLTSIHDYWKNHSLD